jgi:hypothetical protein
LCTHFDASRLLPHGDIVHYLWIAGVGLRNPESQGVLHIAVDCAAQYDRTPVCLDRDVSIGERRFSIEMFLKLLLELRGGQCLWRRSRLIGRHL